MINHILIPLDGSALAECVLPHALAIGRAFGAQLTLLQVLEPAHNFGSEQPVDPLDWHLKRQEAEEYLGRLASQLRGKNLKVQEAIMEGSPAEYIVDFSINNSVDLIALSTHGRSGLSGWNVSSVVQKVILRSSKSILLIRAYKSSGLSLVDVQYNRLFVGLDYSSRAEYILPVAVNLAKYYQSRLVLGTIIRRPEILHRFPLSEDDDHLVSHIAERNYNAASHYFEQLRSQFSMQGIDLETRLIVSDNTTVALHELVEQENADLVMLVAHGHSGESRWPYGSVATSFIAYGTTSLMILQDLSSEEIKRTQAEMVAREIKGH